MRQEKKAIKVFLMVVVLLSACVEGCIIYTGMMPLTALLMWIPGGTALVCYSRFKLKDEMGLLFHKCKMKYILEAILLPFIYIGVPYMIYWGIHPESMKLVINPQFFVIFIVGIPMAMITTIGEEIGWRGFLVPRLCKYIGLEKTLLATSLLWGAWHLPLLISGLYMAGTPMGFKIPFFMIVVFSSGVMIGILTLKSKSVWPAVVFHAAHNHFDQLVFSEATVGDKQMYYVSETGIFTAIIGLLLAVLMYLSYKKTLVQEQDSPIILSK